MLVAINPETEGQLVTETLSSRESVQAFVEKYVGWNLYYSLNPTLRSINKKARREDIAAVEYFHVDLDPRAGEDLESEQARIETLINELPTGIPTPTGIIFSGGGYNLLWKLEQAIPVDGNLDAAEDAKLYNLRLERVLGADNCHNVDRILRLPSTTNWPNARKKKRGREPAEARVVQWNPELIYPVDSFQKAHPVATNAVPKPKIEISGNIRRLSEDELEDLPIAEWCKLVILHGKDPIDEYKYPSRSEALFAVVCEMVRKEISDEVIYSVITDPELKISESVLEKGSSTERYALNQIERARTMAVDPHLLDLNDEFAVIENLGGRVRIVRFVEDPVTGHMKPQRFTFEDFKKMMMNQRIEIRNGDRTRTVGLGDWWLTHPERRQYQQMVFSPARDPKNSLNLWRGFACEALPPDPGETGKHQRYLDHLLENVCGGNKTHFGYLVKWMARAVQNPDLPGYSAVVLRGGQGTGKGIAAREFGSLFGPHFKHVSDASRVTGKHNLHLQDCVVLFADEAFFAGDKQHAAALKRIVTESTLDIEAKYHDAEITPNHLHIIMASNEDWIVPADADDRRFFVLEVADGNKQDRMYFRRIIDDLNNGGREHLLFYLQSLDLTGFEVDSIPQTSALREQKMRSLDPLHAWWYEKLERGYVFDDDDDGWPENVPVDTLKSDFHEHVRAQSKRTGTTTFAMNRFLERVLARKVSTVQLAATTVRVNGEPVPKKKPYAYELPSLSECRAAWDKLLGMESTWSV